MALRASATVKSPLPPPSSSSSSTPTKIFNFPTLSQKPEFTSKSVSVSLSTSTALFLFPLFTATHEARALSLPKEDIVSSLNQVESAVNQAQQVGSNIFDAASRVIGPIIEFVKPGVDVALPLVKQAGEEILKNASPVISDATKKAQEAMQSAGMDTQPVMTAAKTVVDAAQQTSKVIEGAKPIASSTVETISSADPAIIAVAGGSLFLAYLLLPPVFSALSFSLRGYKGELTPAQTLDQMCSKNYVLIDIRTEKDKDKAGIPRLPSSAKNNMIQIPLEDLPSKLRSLVRNAKKVEAELVALKISYLKKINKGSNIVIMDSYSDSAKTVAKTLTSLGFKNCWIMTDGFSGGRGWLQSRLGTDSYNFSFAQVLSPSRVIPAAARRFGTTGTVRLLSGDSD
ncbi:calcium sensing receptor, chloroplastic [Nicotiana sylvestris]|uniref:Calcium sensing receptor, chloroplastic n=1 Tax=Nicotiana sylvestris TaxID=4096 RepID=A0A1U7V6R3_NICSY|nr:PREDICTED: calcium sensing receptor, chloroplastic [Nicotiana sylvestris]